MLWLNPRLPHEISCIELPVRYRGHWLDLLITHERIGVSFRRGWSPEVRVGVRGEIHTFEPGQSREFPNSRRADGALLPSVHLGVSVRSIQIGFVNAIG